MNAFFIKRNTDSNFEYSIVALESQTFLQVAINGVFN